LEKIEMRAYFALEVFNKELNYWIEIEISDNLDTVDRFYEQWCIEMPEAIFRLMEKVNLRQSK